MLRCLLVNLWFDLFLRHNLQMLSCRCFEQVYMDIAISPKEIDPGISTHVEHAPTNFLSILANMTPFSDFNQSPRNIYQCQVSDGVRRQIQCNEHSLDGEANNGNTLNCTEPSYG